MSRKGVSWFERHHVGEIGQWVIVGLMVASLWFTWRALSLTQELATDPYLDFYWQAGDSLHIRNISAVAAHHLEVIAILAAEPDPNTRPAQLSTYSIGSTRRVIRTSVDAGQEVVISMKETISIFADSTKPHQAFCVVFWYRHPRTLDKYEELYTFQRMRATRPPEDYIYMPLTVHSGLNATVPRDAQPYAFGLRDELLSTCRLWLGRD